MVARRLLDRVGALTLPEPDQAVCFWADGWVGVARLSRVAVLDCVTLASAGRVGQTEWPNRSGRVAQGRSPA